MRFDIEGRIKKQEQKAAKADEPPCPEEFGKAARAYCETGEFPEGTHPKVKEYTLKAQAFVGVLREGLGISRDQLVRRPFQKEEETDGV
jgi:hypothetical protein